MRIHELAGRLHVGAGSRIGAVTWFPVWSERGLSAPTAYIPRDGRHLTVRECPCPQVNRLLAVNTGASPLLLLQGATLRGGSQDRTCVTTVLVPPAITMEVPVACIERGRWTAPVDDLRLADPVPPRVRARNTAARQRTGSLDAADQAGTGLKSTPCSTPMDAVRPRTATTTSVGTSGRPVRPAYDPSTANAALPSATAGRSGRWSCSVATATSPRCSPRRWNRRALKLQATATCRCRPVEHAKLSLSSRVGKSSPSPRSVGERICAARILGSRPPDSAMPARCSTSLPSVRRWHSRHECRGTTGHRKCNHPGCSRSR